MSESLEFNKLCHKCLHFFAQQSITVTTKNTMAEYFDPIARWSLESKTGHCCHLCGFVATDIGPWEMDSKSNLASERFEVHYQMALSSMTIRLKQ
jgi:hypothetical protein